MYRKPIEGEEPELHHNSIKKSPKTVQGPGYNIALILRPLTTCEVNVVSLYTKYRYIQDLLTGTRNTSRIY